MQKKHQPLLTLTRIVFLVLLMHAVSTTASQKTSVLGKRGADILQEELPSSVKKRRLGTKKNGLKQKDKRQDPEVYAQKRNLRKQVRSRLGITLKKDQDIYCPECSEKFISRTLVEHYLTKHSSSLHECVVCKAKLPWTKFDKHSCGAGVERKVLKETIAPTMTDIPLPAPLAPAVSASTLPSLAQLRPETLQSYFALRYVMHLNALFEQLINEEQKKLLQ